MSPGTLKTCGFVQTILIVLTCTIVINLNYPLNTVQARSQKKGPIILTEDTWSRMMTGEWMVAFHAPWCPACKNLDPEWRKFADWSDDLDINVASADITKNPGLNGRFMVKGLPTIYHVKDGIFRIYSGPRQHTALVNFIEEQGYKAIEPQSRFWNPNTLQMTFAAYSFKISMELRDLHDHLVDVIGLPFYVSYSIFALGTVLFGTILGFVIVCIIDIICPRLTCNAQETTTSKKKPQTILKQSTKISKSSKKDSDLDEQQDEQEDGDAMSKSDRIRKRTTKADN